MECFLLGEGVIEGTLLHFSRSISRAGGRVHAILIKGATKYVSIAKASRNIDRVIEIDIADERCTDDILSFIAEMAPAEKILFPVTDRAVLFVSEHFDLFEQHFKVIMPQPKLAGTFIDKVTADNEARESGLCVPKTFAIVEGQVNSCLKFPVIIKPLDVAHNQMDGFKAEIFDEPEKANLFSQQLWESGTQAIAQEYIPGGDSSVVFFVFYRSLDGERTYHCTGRKLRQMPAGRGIMARGRTENLPKLETLCLNFLDEIDYRGLGGIEFKEYNDSYYFIEMNVRAEGITQISERCGLDLFRISFLDAISQVTHVPEAKSGKYYVNLFCYYQAFKIGDWRERLVLAGELFRSIFFQNAVVSGVLLDDLKPFFILLKSLFLKRAASAKSHEVSS